MSDNKKPRRDFIKLSAMTLGGVGAASLLIPFYIKHESRQRYSSLGIN